MMVKRSRVSVVAMVLIFALAIGLHVQVAAESENLIPNPSFEEVDDTGRLLIWTYRDFTTSTINVVQDPVVHGKRAVELNTFGDRAGVFVHTLGEVDDTGIYRLSGRYRTKDVDATLVAFRMSFWDADRRPIPMDQWDLMGMHPSMGKCELGSNPELLFCQPTEQTGQSETEWVEFYVDIEPPAGTTNVQVWVKVRRGTQGTVWWDDVRFERID